MCTRAHTHTHTHSLSLSLSLSLSRQGTLTLGSLVVVQLSRPAASQRKPELYPPQLPNCEVPGAREAKHFHLVLISLARSLKTNPLKTCLLKVHLMTSLPKAEFPFGYFYSHLVVLFFFVMLGYFKDLYLFI